jgi:hypothetical protein
MAIMPRLPGGRRTWGIALSLVVLTACGGDDGAPAGDDDVPSQPALWTTAVDHVQLEVDYAGGAEPYTGNVIGFGDLWGLFQANADRLFSNTKVVDVPTTLAEMEAIGAVDDGELTVDDILALAAQHRDLVPSANTATFYVLFLDGYFADDSGTRDTVLGVSIGDTHVLAMFKPVIESTGGVVPNVEKFVEQSVLIHEFGHAVGLVDNGVATTSDHEDGEHVHHCSDDSCVMFWANEGAADAAAFAQQYVTSGDAILFGDECLADVDALTGI